jgi:tol-pal system protein YbgF
VAPAPAIHRADKADKVEPIDADPARAYKAAYDLLRAGQHDAAAERLRAFVRRFPKHEYADNAQYWLGEAFYDRHRYGEAATEFRAAVEKFPLGNKAPDALVKLGYCLLALGDVQKGRDVLKQVPESYPNTDAARLAGEKLAELH